MRLDYTVEPTEILTITTPIGSTYAIPIWRPVGERSAPVMVEVVIPPRAVNYQWLKDRIAKHMASCDTGLTHWQIADALGVNRRTVLRSLMDNSHLFLQSNKQVVVKYYAGINAGERQLRMNLWHLRKETE